MRNRPALFVEGTFKAHSGDALPFKIDCDALSDADLDCLAGIVADRFKGWVFGEVVGVPRGGIRFAEAIDRRVETDGNTVWRPNLIVDDVLTTGQSMEEFWRARYPATFSGIQGVVIFARGPVAKWITPLLTLSATDGSPKR